MKDPSGKLVDRLYANGWAYAEIAAHMGISENAIRLHLKQSPMSRSPSQKITPYVEKRAIYWRRIVPDDVAERQARWELGQSILRAKNSGETYSNLGRFFGLSIERVRQITSKAERQIDLKKKSPVEKLLDHQAVVT